MVTWMIYLIRGMVEMFKFEKKIETFIEKHKLIQKGDRILVAVSGGPDSMALLNFLFKRQAMYSIELAVAHVNHMLRGIEAQLDYEYVEHYCLQRNIPFQGIHIDIRRKMEEDKTGMQETARKYRYLFFEEASKQFNMNKLAVGQHADDQVETILMRLVRGSRGISRAGMLAKRPFKSIQLIRPLLAVTKDEIEQYCLSVDLNPRHDISNDKRDYTRNRFRLDILPFLKQENARVHEQFQRFSEDVIEDEQFLQSLANEKFTEICQQLDTREISLSVPHFLMEPLPLQRRVIHLILNYLYNNKNVDLTTFHTENIQGLLEGKHPSKRLDLPLGLKVIRSYHLCRFTFDNDNNDHSYRFELLLGDKVVLPNKDAIRVETGQVQIKYNEDLFIVDPEHIQLPIIVRTRKPGDRIQLKGLNGTKKVKDLLIDLKVPQEKRSSWPIVTDQAGKLLWIPGLRKSRFEAPIVHSHYVYIIYSNHQPLL